VEGVTSGGIQLSPCLMVMMMMMMMMMLMMMIHEFQVKLAFHHVLVQDTRLVGDVSR
jgi:hypothetical protein